MHTALVLLRSALDPGGAPTAMGKLSAMPQDRAEPRVIAAVAAMSLAALLAAWTGPTDTRA